ncbi:MAG: hypothetical protein Q8Q24_00595, partial [bacterium]|nr:hypothetical protein [bacterium]
MNKNIIFAIIALVVLGGGYFLLKASYQNPNSSAGQNTSQVSQSPANTIAAQNFAFNPQVLNVAAGTKVTWTNQDSTLHDVTSLTEG